MHSYNGNPEFKLSEHITGTHIKDVNETQCKITLRLCDVFFTTPTSQDSTRPPSNIISLSQLIPVSQNSTSSFRTHHPVTMQFLPSPHTVSLDTLLPHGHNSNHHENLQRTYSRSLLLKFQDSHADEDSHPSIQTTTPNILNDLPKRKARSGRTRVFTNSEGYKFYLKDKKKTGIPKIKEFNNSQQSRTPPPSPAPGHPTGMNKECTPNTVNGKMVSSVYSLESFKRRKKQRATDCPTTTPLR